MQELKTKFKAGRYMVPVTLVMKDGRIFFHFPYNKKLIEEVKTTMEKRKWHGFDPVPQKCWSVPVTPRNLFRIRYLQNTNPYARYDVALDYSVIDTLNERPLYAHQRDLVAHGYLTRQFIWAADMGTGKTLAAIVLMELSGLTEWLWVGPKSALRAAKEEMRKWKCRVVPEFLTYEGLKKYVSEWPEGREAPEGVIFDESVKIKTPTAQRSIAARHLANSMREDHESPIVGLLSGAPAPKSPIDWWHQCEVACPGFLREKDINTFRERMGIFTKEESDTGTYLKLNTWLDDERKCGICGKVESDHFASDHRFIKSVNEVAKLYTRMKGLVLVKMKEDCLDLPEKIYEVIEVQPTQEIVNTAKIITSTARRAIEALTLCRELSDGFQYRQTVVGQEVCPRCNGTKVCFEFYDPEFPDFPVALEFVERGVRPVYNDEGEITAEEPLTYSKRSIPCPHCEATGSVDRYERTVIEVPCPKDDILLEQLELHDDIGRLNIYAGFTASVDKIVRICARQKWGVIRADGRGWSGVSSSGAVLPSDKLLQIYAEGEGRLAFVGQAGAAGMGLTLTASPTTFFYSNTFNGDDRIQAENRGHRIGMDVERGGRILDVVHLPTDRLILDNLQKKKDLQKMSMTGVAECLS